MGIVHVIMRDEHLTGLFTEGCIRMESQTGLFGLEE
jgi:hypothetical protein